MRPNRSTRIFISPPRDRDEELVRLASRHGLLELTHVMSALDIGRTAAYRRVADASWGWRKPQYPTTRRPLKRAGSSAMFPTGKPPPKPGRKGADRPSPLTSSGQSSGHWAKRSPAQPNASRPPKRRNPARERGFRKRLKGFEPSTFCMATRPGQLPPPLEKHLFAGD